ncbi:ABC transporter substrate-binding protein [Aromatoleum toluclasticum]|uniref:ABC transporter substrate-binding protein n=1 Tax=Aromatoleum toluclasticum TaxID=92003 RepID=UPI001D18E4AB|nr:ABC transporter substrate-binding protein [Aromatoleum toluclasticum]MCC4116858.1 ABC transporter substrate-binding protein [Aromatoleum toluclasticum]
MKRIASLFAAVVAAASFVLPLSAAADEGKPQVIRLGFPGTGTGNRPVLGGNPLATAHLQGLLEEEFKPDNIKIEWNHFKFAGPAINEAFANDLLDFSYEGDLAMIIGKAAGLKVKVLAGGGMRLPVAVAVPSESQIRTLADLKGKRLAIAKGTAIQLASSRILARVGLEEKDLRAVNVLGANATDALATKDIDAVVSTPSAFYPLRDRGVARIIYESTTPELLISGGFVATEHFIAKYPEITKRVVKVFVKAAQHSSDEANRTALFKLWGQDGTGFGYYKEQYGKDVLAEHQTPLLDDYWVGRFKDGIADALRFRLIRKDIDVAAWLEPSFLNAALKELQLENHWVRYAYDGKPVKGLASN